MSIINKILCKAAFFPEKGKLFQNLIFFLREKMSTAVGEDAAMI